METKGKNNVSVSKMSRRRLRNEIEQLESQIQNNQQIMKECRKNEKKIDEKIKTITNEMRSLARFAPNMIKQNHNHRNQVKTIIENHIEPNELDRIMTWYIEMLLEDVKIKEKKLGFSKVATKQQYDRDRDFYEISYGNSTAAFMLK